jgi:dTDP-L-rhamnose 4-epimerase
MTRVLVTGGAGLIGSHLVDELVTRGASVRILDNLSPSSHRGRPAWVPDEAEFVKGDVRDSSCLERCLSGIEDVYHLAAAVGGVTNDLAEFFDVNATGTARLFEVIERKRYDIRKIVAPSSQAVYGEGLYRCPLDGTVQPDMRSIEAMHRGAWEPACPKCDGEITPELTDESARSNGETPYAVSKIAQERTVLALGRRLGIPTVALRYAVVFGPRQSVFNPYTGILSIFSTLMLNGKQPRAFEDGHATRDFVYVDDVVRATILAMEDSRADGREFNVGRGAPLDIVSVIEALATAYGREGDYVITGEFRPGDVRHLVLDVGRLRALGWQPLTPLEEGLERTAEWILGLGQVSDLYSHTLATLRSTRVVLQSHVD